MAGRLLAGVAGAARARRRGRSRLPPTAATARRFSGSRPIPKIDLFATIPHGTGQTYLREILLVADHAAYHIGADRRRPPSCSASGRSGWPPREHRAAPPSHPAARRRRLPHAGRRRAMVRRRAGPGISRRAVGGRPAHASARPRLTSNKRWRSATIVRTWPLRGTLHFAAPEDVRWMLACFAPRTIARAGAALHATRARSAHAFAERRGRHQGAAKAGGSCRGRGCTRGSSAPASGPAKAAALHILWQLRARRPDLLRRARRETAHVRAAGRVDPAGEGARPATKRWRSSRAATSPATARRR